MFEGAHCKFSQSAHFLMSDEILIFRHLRIAGASSSHAIDNETPYTTFHAHLEKKKEITG
jgi:hypothetical protein